MNLTNCNSDLIPLLEANTVYLMVWSIGISLKVKPTFHSADGKVVIDYDGRPVQRSVDITDNTMPLAVYSDDKGPMPIKTAVGSDNLYRIISLLSSFHDILSLDNTNDMITDAIRHRLVQEYAGYIPMDIEDADRYVRGK